VADWCRAPASSVVSSGTVVLSSSYGSRSSQRSVRMNFANRRVGGSSSMHAKRVEASELLHEPCICEPPQPLLFGRIILTRRLWQEDNQRRGGVCFESERTYRYAVSVCEKGRRPRGESGRPNGEFRKRLPYINIRRKRSHLFLALRRGKKADAGGKRDAIVVRLTTTLLELLSSKQEWRRRGCYSHEVVRGRCGR